METNLALFQSISMLIKTNYIPIMAQGVFQKYVEDIFTFNNDNDDKPEKEFEGVTIEDDVEDANIEQSEPDVPDYEIEIEEINSDNEPDDEPEEKIDIQEINSDNEPEEEIEDEVEENNKEDEKVQKRSPVPSKLSPYKEKKEKKKGKKDKHVNDANETVISAKVSLDRIKLPKRNLNITNENIRTPSGNITMKAYKPNDVLISTLRDIDVQQLRKGDYSIHDLKRFATSLNISTTSKIEDLQQQILDIIENYVA